MKKSFFVVFFFAFLLSMSFASAYFLPSVRFVSQDIVNTVTDFMEPILYALFGGFATVYLFETLLVFLIVFCLVFLSLGKVPFLEEQKAIRRVLTVVVSLLAVRFLDYEWLITVFNTYKVLGIVLSSILPFIIYFYFLYNVAGEHGIIRKLGWVLWIAVYIGLWSSSYVTEETSMVYFWTFIVGAVCLLGDNMINRKLRWMQQIKRDENFKERQISTFRQQIHDMNLQIAAGTMDPKFGREQIKELEKQIKEIRKM